MDAGKIDILAIDDDKFIHKVIAKALQSDRLSIRTAADGETGIREASEQRPDIILLDVEMPDINGYEVCDRLRNMASTRDVPIVFLSSHSSLRERMQGYEVGGDDYLVKPFEKEHLLARINVLVKYHNERRELRQQYELAQKSAMIAMTGSSELGLAIKLMEKSVGYANVNDVAQALLEITDQLGLDCCAMVVTREKTRWYSSENSAISPLEKELLEMSDHETRFVDFGSRTIVNFPLISLLAKNMPLGDMDRYGRVKDLLPVLLSVTNSKINALGTHEALSAQSEELLQSFNLIRSSLYHLGSTLVKHRHDSEEIMHKLVQDLNYDFLRMGLEEEQEDFLLTRIDNAIDQAMIDMDSGKDIRASLTFVLNNLNNVINRQKALLDEYTANLSAEAPDHGQDLDDNVELF